MDSGDAGQIRRPPVAISASRLHVIAVFLEDVGQLDLTGAALSL